MQFHDSKLQQLELAHADPGTLEDIEHSNALSTTATQTEPGYFLSLRIVGTVLGLGIALSTSYWGFVPVAAVLQTINADIGPSDNASLFSIIWSICAAIGILLFGRLSDKFGRRWFVISASFMAVVAAIIAATAQRMNTLIGANVILGLAAGVHTCHGLTVGEVVANRWKLFASAVAACMNVLPTGFGNYLAARLVRYHNWRYIYYIFIPLMSFATLLQFLFYRPPSFRQLHGMRTRRQELKRVDFIGISLMVAGLLLFLLGVSWGGQPLPWTSSTILALIIVGGVLMVAFVFWEIYGLHPNPIVPMHFFRDLRGFTCATTICAVAGVSFVAPSIIWPSQVGFIYGSSGLSWSAIAWLTTTTFFGVYLGYIVFGPLVVMIKHVRYQIIVMMLIMVSFTGAMASCNPSNLARSAVFSFFAGLPVAWLEMVPVLLIQMDSNDVDLGTVYAICYSFRAIVGSIMTTVYLAILSTKTKAEILKYVPKAVIQAGLPETSVPDLLLAIAAGGTPETLSQVDGITPAIEQTLGTVLPTAYAAAYAYVYYAAVAVGCVGLIASFCIKDYDEYFTDHVPRQIYKINDGDQDRRLEDKLGHEMQQHPEEGKEDPSTVTPSASADSNGPATTLEV